MARIRKFSSRKTSARRSVKRTFKRKSYAPKKSSVKAIVKREIARNTENKCSQFYQYDNRLYTAGNVSFPTDNVFPVCVGASSIVIPQGSGQGNRIGNVIKTKKFMFRGTIVPLPYDGTFNPQPQPLQVKMWIFYDKTQPNVLPNPQNAADFFQNGITNKGFQNDLVDMWSPVNTDRYRILATRNFKLGWAGYMGTGTLPTFQSFTNNDFKANANFSIDLTKHVPLFTKFNDGSSAPTTRGLYCMISYAYSSGGQAPVTGYMANLSYMLDYQYEDA